MMICSSGMGDSIYRHACTICDRVEMEKALSHHHRRRSSFSYEDESSLGSHTSSSAVSSDSQSALPELGLTSYGRLRVLGRRELRHARGQLAFSTSSLVDLAFGLKPTDLSQHSSLHNRIRNSRNSSLRRRTQHRTRTSFKSSRMLSNTCLHNNKRHRYKNLTIAKANATRNPQVSNNNDDDSGCSEEEEFLITDQHQIREQLSTRLVTENNRPRAEGHQQHRHSSAQQLSAEEDDSYRRLQSSVTTRHRAHRCLLPYAPCPATAALGVRQTDETGARATRERRLAVSPRSRSTECRHSYCQSARRDSQNHNGFVVGDRYLEFDNKRERHLSVPCTSGALHTGYSDGHLSTPDSHAWHQATSLNGIDSGRSLPLLSTSVSFNSPTATTCALQSCHKSAILELPVSLSSRSDSVPSHRQIQRDSPTINALLYSKTEWQALRWPSVTDPSNCGVTDCGLRLSTLPPTTALSSYSPPTQPQVLPAIIHGKQCHIPSTLTNSSVAQSNISSLRAEEFDIEITGHNQKQQQTQSKEVGGLLYSAANATNGDNHQSLERVNHRDDHRNGVTVPRTSGVCPRESLRDTPSVPVYDSIGEVWHPSVVIDPLEPPRHGYSALKASPATRYLIDTASPCAVLPRVDNNLHHCAERASSQPTANESSVLQTPSLHPIHQHLVFDYSNLSKSISLQRVSLHKPSQSQAKLFKTFNSKMTTKGILKTSKLGPEPIKMSSNKPLPKKCITFANSNPEIIGYCDLIEDDDELELSGNQIAHLDPCVEDETEDDEADPERAALKQITDSNTLFNSKYANFKTDTSGVLGRPKGDSGQGVVKFQIQDGYQQPLAPTTFATNSIRRMFENSQVETQSRQTTQLSDTKKTVGNIRNAFENTNNASQKSPPNDSVQNLSNNLKSKAIGSSSKTTENAYFIERIDLDKIRIPRATILSEKIKSPSKRLNNKYDKVHCDKLIESAQTEANDTEDILVKTKLESASETKDSAAVIVVDSVEGSILTLDSKNLSHLNKCEKNDFYILPQVTLHKSPQMESEESNQLDSMSEFSTSSGCCSVNSSSPSPIHTETCSSSSPDSLDSTPDSYDLVKCDSDELTEPNHELIVSNPQRRVISLSKSDEVETIESCHQTVRVSSQLKTALLDSPRQSVNGQCESSMAQESKQDRSMSCSTVSRSADNNTNSSLDESTVDEATNELPVLLQSVKLVHNEFNDSGYASPPSSDRYNSNSPMPVLNNKTLISISYRTSSQINQPDSEVGSTIDKRSQMLAKMAQDLQKHRAESELSRSTSTHSNCSLASLSSGGSGQQSTDSFRERLYREAFEDMESNHIANNGSLFKTCTSKKIQMGSDGSASDGESDDSNSDCDTDLSKSSDSECDTPTDTKLSNNSLNQAKSKPTAFLKNVVNSKKYTKLMKKNLSKTSKFILSTTQQLKSDTSDMVRKLKSDKKATDNDGTYFYPDEYESAKSKSKWVPSDTTAEPIVTKNEKKGKKGSFDVFSKNSGQEMYNLAKNAFKLNLDGKWKSKAKGGASEFPVSSQNEVDKEEEPTLLKLKRLESVPPSSALLPEVTGVNRQNKPPVPPRIALKPVPIRSTSIEAPPVAPARRKRVKDTIKHRTVDNVTLSTVKQDFSIYLNGSQELTSDLDNAVDIIEDLKSNLRQYRLFRGKFTSSNSEIYLLTSSVVWTTCYDRTTHMVWRYKGDNCRVMPTRWTKFVSISSFCEQLNKIDSSNCRMSLVDSLVLQLYSIMARFEGCTRKEMCSGTEPPRTVGDINDALVGMAVDKKEGSDETIVSDVLLLLPTKTIDIQEEESLELDSLSLMQAFCLQVFLMRLTRLIANNDELSMRRKPSHYSSLVQRVQQFSSLKELQTLSAIDIFRVLKNDQSGTPQEQIQAWFHHRRTSRDFVQRFYQLSNGLNVTFKPVSVLDFLEVDFALNANPQETFELVHKELSENM